MHIAFCNLYCYEHYALEKVSIKCINMCRCITLLLYTYWFNNDND